MLWNLSVAYSTVVVWLYLDWIALHSIVLSIISFLFIQSLHLHSDTSSHFASISHSSSVFPTYIPHRLHSSWLSIPYTIFIGILRIMKYKKIKIKSKNKRIMLWAYQDSMSEQYLILHHTLPFICILRVSTLHLLLLLHCNCYSCEWVWRDSWSQVYCVLKWDRECDSKWPSIFSTSSLLAKARGVCQNKTCNDGKRWRRSQGIINEQTDSG